jgi:hypothetical protein
MTNPSILILASAAHTGTRFLEHLLNVHPMIGESIDEFSLSSAGAGSQLWYKSQDGFDAVLNSSLAPLIIGRRSSATKYALLRAHIRCHWFAPILYYQPFPFKLIVPVRNPYNVLASHYFRCTGNRPVMGHYLTMIYALGLGQDAVVVPVDLMADWSPDERIKWAEEVFVDWLGIGMCDPVHDATLIWEPMGCTDEGLKRNLEAWELDEIHQRVQNSTILNKLSAMGIHYKPEVSQNGIK